MNKTTYHISEMDCPCEENLIRTKLVEEKNISQLKFNISERKLEVYHDSDNKRITALIDELGLGSKPIAFVEGIEVNRIVADENKDEKLQRKVLKTVLAINFIFFGIEIATGFVSHSMGLVADSLDMLADALVYGMSLMAVGAVLNKKKQVARLSGWLQILLAVIGFGEVIHRVTGAEVMPDFRMMIIISTLALIANVSCLWILQRMQSREAHIRAGVIFSANDVVINMGVIAAACMVWWFDSYVPDLIIGIIVFVIVMKGALKILKLAK